MRILEQHKVAYETIEYPSEIKNAEEVAEIIGIPEYMVFKTLVAQSVTGGNPFLVMLPSNTQLDLKKIAKVVGEKKVKLVSHAEAERLTGLQVGGISALALMHKNWNVYLDQSATENQHICISAGQRGTQIRVPTNALMQITRAKLVDVGTIID